MAGRAVWRMFRLAPLMLTLSEKEVFISLTISFLVQEDLGDEHEEDGSAVMEDTLDLSQTEGQCTEDKILISKHTHQVGWFVSVNKPSDFISQYCDVVNRLLPVLGT